MAKTKDTEPFYQKPSLFPIYKFETLSIIEREEFRKFIASPLGKKLVRNAYCRKPTSFAVSQEKWAESSSQVSVNRLHQIQGWELFEAAFFSQAEEKTERPKVNLVENYQEP